MIWLWYFYRRYPFTIKGYTLYYCHHCKGWGVDPRDTDDCPICYAQGYIKKCT